MALFVFMRRIQFQVTSPAATGSFCWPGRLRAALPVLIYLIAGRVTKKPPRCACNESVQLPNLQIYSSYLLAYSHLLDPEICNFSEKVLFFGCAWYQIACSDFLEYMAPRFFSSVRDLYLRLHGSLDQSWYCHYPPLLLSPRKWHPRLGSPTPIHPPEEQTM